MVGLDAVASQFVGSIDTRPSVAAARVNLSSVSTLVLTDTALAGAAENIIDTLVWHARRGGQIVVVRVTAMPWDLSADVPDSHVLILPATTLDLARVLGVECRRNLPVVVDQQLWQHRTTADPILAWKKGSLYIGPDGEIRVAGAFAGSPVPLDCNAPPGTPGYSAFVERHSAEGAFLGAALITVALSGAVERLVTPRADGNGFLASHQRVVAIELSARCQKHCGAVATELALFARDWGHEIVAVCSEHAGVRPGVDFAVLSSRLHADGVALHWDRGVVALPTVPDRTP